MAKTNRQLEADVKELKKKLEEKTHEVMQLKESISVGQAYDNIHKANLITEGEIKKMSAERDILQDTILKAINPLGGYAPAATGNAYIVRPAS